ncbi:hypothetical protein [Rheinheimera baltica]|uniref:hypothetical protein n=1 Tax=Rheinheimera baltica TaxID=67576 RepID=UPI0004891F1A|nr:hypothetical protein [Rheinheimera baltica]
MRKHTAIFLVSIMAASLTACITYKAPRYQSSAETLLHLQQLEAAPVALKGISRPAGIKDHEQCQTQGQVKASGGYANYVDAALRSELANANLLADSAPVEITGYLQTVKFNSWKNSWYLTLELMSSNGHKFTTQTTYRGEGRGYEEETSCLLVAQSMPSAVKQLLQDALTSKDFAALLQTAP